MAYTADDLVKIERLIAGGVQRVRFSDGREVQNAPVQDLMAIRSDIRASLATGGARPVVRQIHVYTDKGF
jgi:hypothetical protein